MRYTLFAGLLIATASAAIASLFSGANIARGSHAGGMDAMSIDLDTTGNTATSLGPLDSCLSVSPPASFDLDVTALNIPATAFGGMSAFGFTLNYDAGAGAQTVTGNNPNFLLAVNPGSSIMQIVDPTPDSDGAFNSAANDASASPGETGSGVLARITLTVGAGAAPGVYPLTLTGAAHLDEGGFPYLPDNTNNAVLVIGGSCTDYDGDGIANADDACPTMSGPASNAGCPPPGPPAVGGIMGLLEGDGPAPAPAMAADTGASGTTITLQAVAGLLILLGTVVLVRHRVAR